MILNDSQNGLCWKTPEAVDNLAPDQIALWLIDTPARVPLEALEQTLGHAEKERAARFARPELRERFIEAHGLLRRMLGQYLSLPPQDILLGQEASGKPCLENAPFAFNLSHTDGKLLLAYSPNHPVGVDIERIRPLDDYQAMARRFFAPEECATILEAAPEIQLDCFFACWTRKEACVKAQGQGLRTALDAFRVPIADPPPTPVPIALPDRAPWFLLPVPRQEGYRLALASDAPLPLHCWHVKADSDYFMTR